MRKFLCITYLALQSSISFATDTSENLTDEKNTHVGIYLTWPVKESTFKLIEEAYDQHKTEVFNEICLNFHTADSTAEKQINGKKMSEDDYENYMREMISKRSNWLKERTVSLLLSYKDEVIVGGTYYLTEQDGKIVRITCAGFKRDLDKQEIGLAQKQLLDALSSKKYFPNAEKLIVNLRNNSAYSEILKIFDFVSSDYAVETELSPEDYCTFERIVK